MITITCLLICASVIANWVIRVVRWRRLMAACNAQIESAEAAIEFQREMSSRGRL